MRLLLLLILPLLLMAQTSPSVSQITLRPPSGLPCVVVSPPNPGGPLVCATIIGASLATNSTQGWQLIVSGPQFAYNETPTGAVDGHTSVFTLQHAPAPPASLEVVRNGLVLSVGIDFAVQGNSVTFMPGSVPMPGDNLIARSYQF